MFGLFVLLWGEAGIPGAPWMVCLGLDEAVSALGLFQLRSVQVDGGCRNGRCFGCEAWLVDQEVLVHTFMGLGVCSRGKGDARSTWPPGAQGCRSGGHWLLELYVLTQ
jgi:hypothetical protein